MFPRTKREAVLTILIVGMALWSVVMFSSEKKIEAERISRVDKAQNYVLQLGIRGLAELCLESPSKDIFDGKCNFQLSWWAEKPDEVIVDVNIVFWQDGNGEIIWPATKNGLANPETLAKAHVEIEIRGDKYTRRVEEVLYRR